MALRPRDDKNQRVTSLAPYDTVLLLSFGGPEQPADVLPFLREVTRGRGISEDRLARVAEHYHYFGGRSPINEHNRALQGALQGELNRRGCPLPVLWGNRNWHPYVVDVLRQGYADGARRVLTILTSAYSSYSSCRQYREDLAQALITLAGEGISLSVDKIRHYYNHPGFAQANVDATVAALQALPDGAHVVFVTHSVPDAMDEAAGPAGHAYTEQHRDLAAVVAADAGARLGRVVPWQLAYCSRSGPAGQPWLEPDVGDHLRGLHAVGAPGAAVVPIGFVSDHMEVVYDLDTEAKAVADELGLPFARAATAGTHPRFVGGLVDLLQEQAAIARGEQPPAPSVGARGASHSVCPAGCCRNPREERPAACGTDWTPPVLGQPATASTS